MPFFDANKMGITIDYDDNMSISGGSLRGVVNIFVRETVSLCGASLRYRIVEGCSLGSARPDYYDVEYVLFGARSTKHALPVRVTRGHYSYPFAIPIPMNAPPTQRFGGNGDSSLLSIFGKEVVPSSSPPGPAVRVEHLVDVVVYVAFSWKDKHQSKNAPCVVSCTSPSMLLATNNGMEGHIRNGYSISYPGKGFFSKLFNSGPSKTKEQADADLFIYNTVVSLADSPFLHFAIRGKSNCPFRIELIRVISYTHPVDEEPPKNGNASQRNQTESSAVAASRNPANESRSGRQKPPVVVEHVISSTTMPPFDAPHQGVRGRLLISPFSQEHSVTFQSRTITVCFYVTMSLQYLSNKERSTIPNEHKMRIPITIYHGTFEEAVAGVVEGGAGFYHQEAPASGAVMGYDAPPMGEAALFRPAAPVTDAGVTTTQWANPAYEPVLMRPTNAAANAANKSSSTTLRTTASAAASTNATAKTAAPMVPSYPNNNAPAPPASTAANSAHSSALVMSRMDIPETTVNRREVSTKNKSCNSNERQVVAECVDFAPISAFNPDLAAAANTEERHSAYRRMYENVAPTWVRAERQTPADPIQELPTPSSPSSEAASTANTGESVTTTTFI